MKLSRMDLDGAGSPAALVARILELEPGLQIPIPLEQLCAQLDIVSIGELETSGFEAALVTDRVKSSGGILVAKASSPRRRRFSIAHELGHFLIPTHMVPERGVLECSLEQLRQLDVKQANTRARMEAEANRFAALLLMPPPILRAELAKIRAPQVTDIVRLAALFNVSKNAFARSMVEYSRHALAVISVSDGRIARFYRNERQFPWLDIRTGDPVPTQSNWHDRVLLPGETSENEECEPEVWLSPTAARKVEVLVEQALGQRDGFGMILLHAEMRDDDDGGLEPVDRRWR